VKDVHLYTALAWVVLVVLLILVGLHHGLRQTIRELERFDAQDLRWLVRRRGRAGRFTRARS
jgi:hypothetical protein